MTNKIESMTTSKSSSKTEALEMNWRKNLQIYYIINNLSTLCVLILLSKCIYTLHPSLTAIILFLSSYTFITLFSISTIYFSRSSSSSSIKYEIVEYIKNMPLCYLTFYYFTKLSALKSTNSFDYNLLLLSTIYFSVQTIVNCILIEIKPSSLLRIRFTNMLFLFLFRYFFFMAKLLSSVLMFATLLDPTFIAVVRSSADFFGSIDSVLIKSPYLFTLLLLLALFAGFLAWYLAKFRDAKLFHAAFESYKLLIEYNGKFLDRCPIRATFMCGQFLLYLTSAYFWFYRAIVVFAKARTKTSLIGLLTRQSHLRVVVDLYELEEKMKSRQFEFVCLLGSVLVAYLAQYIYYSYYEITEDKRLIQSHRTQTQFSGRYVDGRIAGLSAAVQQQQDDSFLSSDNFKQHSSSISSWIASSAASSTSSSSSGIFNLHHHLKHKNMDFSSCCTSIDRYMFDEVFGDSLLSNDVKLDFLIGGCDHNKYRHYYDSSSGVASSETSSSLSSIYHEFTATATNAINPSYFYPQPITKPITSSLLLQANEKSNNLTATTNIHDKVLHWIKSTEKCEENNTVVEATSLWSQSQSQQPTETNTNIIASFVNTDSTIKTDQTNFTYFI